MTQYNSLNVSYQIHSLISLKSAIKNETDVVSRLSSNMTGNSDDETNFSHKLLLTNRQVTTLRKAFAHYLSTDVKLSKTQLSKMIQLGGFLVRLLGTLLKIGLPLMKSVIQPLAKSVLIPLGLTAAAASAADTGIHKKVLGFGHNTTLIISNDEIRDILEIVKALEDSGQLLKGVSETIKNEAGEQKEGFLSKLLGTLGAIQHLELAMDLKDLLLKKFFDSTPSFHKLNTNVYKRIIKMNLDLMVFIPKIICLTK